VGGALPDQVAHWTVVAVDHPSLGRDRLSHAQDEFLGIVSGQIAPSRLPVDRVELDVQRNRAAILRANVVFPAPDVPTTTILISRSGSRSRTPFCARSPKPNQPRRCERRCLKHS
jgi:hypothetical protein